MTSQRRQGRGGTREVSPHRPLLCALQVHAHEQKQLAERAMDLSF